MSFRQATLADMPRIREAHREIEQRHGQPMDLPACDDVAILGYWVVERDGQIIGGAYIEKCFEWCQFGTDPQASAELRLHALEIFARVQRAGGRALHCMVPPAFEEVGRHLENAQLKPTGFTHYRATLRTNL